MDALERRVLLFGVPLAVILAAFSIYQIKQLPQRPSGGQQGLLTTAGGFINVDKQQGPTPSLSCYAEVAWVNVTSGQTQFAWVNNVGADLELTFSTNAILDKNGKPVVSPLPFPKDTTVGPFTIDGGTVSGCQTTGTLASCYLPYDITAAKKSCEDHDAHYFTGIQITR